LHRGIGSGAGERRKSAQFGVLRRGNSVRDDLPAAVAHGVFRTPSHASRHGVQSPSVIACVSHGCVFPDVFFDALFSDTPMRSMPRRFAGDVGGIRALRPLKFFLQSC
jgi:hypothetical protein